MRHFNREHHRKNGDWVCWDGFFVFACSQEICSISLSNVHSRQRRRRQKFSWQNWVCQKMRTMNRCECVVQFLFFILCVSDHLLFCIFNVAQQRNSSEWACAHADKCNLNSDFLSLSLRSWTSNAFWPIKQQ